MSTVRTLAKLEATLEGHISSFELMREPVDYGFWWGLTAFEKLNYRCALSTIDSASLEMEADNLKYGLMYFLRWMRKYGRERSEFSPPKSINLRRNMQSMHLVDLCKFYKPLSSYIWLVKNDKADVICEDENALRFVSSARRMQFDALDWLLHNRKLESRMVEFESDLSAQIVLKQSSERLAQCLRVRGNWNIEASFNIVDLRNVSEITSLYRKDSRSTPLEWSFHGIPISAFREVLSVIEAIILLPISA